MRSRPVCNTELLAAAGEAGDLSDLLARLGLVEIPSRRRHVRARLLRLGEDTSRWPPLRQRYRREVLEAAVAASSSFAGVLRALQVKQAGGSQSHLARRIRQEGLDTSRFTGQASQRGGKRASTRPEDVLVVRPPGSHASAATASARRWWRPACRTAAPRAACRRPGEASG